MRTIGAIFDTHGLLRPQTLAALAGCDPAVLPSPREIDMVAIGSFSKAFAGPLVRKSTTEIKEGA